jgi:hypothetical protein
MKSVRYDIGLPEKDGFCLLYGFQLPNNTSEVEREITAVPFRWAEQVAGLKAPVSETDCRGLTLKVSSPKPQKLTLFQVSGNKRKILGTMNISGEKRWEQVRLEFSPNMRFAPADLIQLEAEKQYLGIWRQNCYRLSQVQFHFTQNVHSKLWHEFRREDTYQYRLLFGDPHVHSNASICSRIVSFGTLQENVDKALEGGLDFMHFSDHTDHFLHFEEALPKLYEMYHRYSEPPFIVIPGYEWSSKSYGNYNVYFDAIPPPEAYAHSEEQRGNSLPKLWAVCRQSGTQFLTIPHHTYHPLVVTNTSYPIPEEYQSAVEICSCWGSSERYDPDQWNQQPEVKYPFSLNPGFYVDDMLRRGMKLGFVGGSDAHPIWPGSAGLTGVYVEEFSLKGIFESIQARRTFATNGAKIKLRVTANGYPMGHIFKVNQYSINALFPLLLVIDVEGSSAITRVELIANGSLIRAVDCTGDDTHAHIEWEVPRGTYELTDTNRFYYVRVTQREGSGFWPQQGMAWSSPIWIDYQFNENPVGTVSEESTELIDMHDHQMAPFAEPRHSSPAPKRRKLMDL